MRSAGIHRVSLCYVMAFPHFCRFLGMVCGTIAVGRPQVEIATLNLPLFFI